MKCILAISAAALLFFGTASTCSVRRDPQPDGPRRVDELPLAERSETEIPPIIKPDLPGKELPLPPRPVDAAQDTTLADLAGMVYIPEGYFFMTQDAPGQRKSRVYLDAFYIDKYEVSNRDFHAFIQAGGYRTRSLWSEDGWKWRSANNITMPRWWDTGRYNIGMEFPDNPVAAVSWYEAEAYARWVGKRLPTEAEWEKASRGTDERLYPWGDQPIVHRGVYYANFYSDGDGFRFTAPVLSFEIGRSPYGCYNMLGNVWEWVNDWRPEPSYYRSIPERNPRGVQRGTEKILRGGSWYKSPGFYETAFRLHAVPGTREYDDIGFRCAVDAKPQK